MPMRAHDGLLAHLRCSFEDVRGGHGYVSVQVRDIKDEDGLRNRGGLFL